MTPYLLAVLVFSSEAVVEPAEPRLGDPAIVYVTDVPHGRKAGRIEAFGYAFALQPVDDDVLRAVIAVPADIEPGPYPAAAVHPNLKTPLAIELSIAGRTFERSDLTVAKKFTKKKRSKALQARLRRETKAIQRVWSAKPTRARVLRTPVRPTKTKVTGVFGTVRVFNKTRRSVHYGIDLDGRIGEPVRASASGRVVMSSMRWGSGGTIVVDHGGGLYTTYFHLSKRRVRRGQRVKKGQRIGNVGRSGRVTGPHLHFGVAVRAEWLKGRKKGSARSLYVDPEAFWSLDLRGSPVKTATTAKNGAH